MRTRFLTRRVVRALAFATAVAVALAWRGGAAIAQAPPVCGTDLRLLVVSANGGERDLSAIQAALDYLGTPYDLYIATQHPGGMTPDRLAVGCHANYQGIILTTDTLMYATAGGTQVSALTSGEFQALSDYEAAFSIRQATWFTTPTSDNGFIASNTTTSAPFTVDATGPGAQLFSYLNTTPSRSSIPVSGVSAYLTTPFDGTTIPLLVDNQGHSLAGIHTYPNGRQNLALLLDSDATSLHATLLSYGVINWLTSGLFIGERHTYVSPHVDDFFAANTLWLSTMACDTNVNQTGAALRITGADLNAAAAWQAGKNAAPLTANLRLTLAFNGAGMSGVYPVVGASDQTTGAPFGPITDTLTPAATAAQQNFWWANHTLDHTGLDPLTYSAAVSEITQNSTAASQHGFVNYLPAALVQPDASGLGNAAALQAAYDSGVRMVIGDASRTGQNNPSPNVGFWNTTGQPGLFVVPRRATNLLFNVATPADWLARYNCVNASSLNYQQLLDQEADRLAQSWLRGDLDPTVFHQTNLGAYDGIHSVLGDLLDRALVKYSGYVTLPVVSPALDTIGTRMANRTLMRTAGITASIQAGGTLSLLSPVNVTVPITGLRLPGAEQYGGQWISWVTLQANTPLVEPLLTDPALSIADARHDEGNSGITNFSFLVTMSPPSTSMVTVAFATADGTAVAGSDYAAQSGTLTFAPGVTSQTIVVPVIGDTVSEPDETFSVILSAPTNATIARAQAVGVIANDDLAHVIDRFPVANEAAATLGTSVAVWFDTQMDPSTFTASSFRVRASGAASDVPGAIVVTNDSYKIGIANSSTAVFTPGAPLAPATVYTATLAGTVADTFGTPIGVATSWSFTTGPGVAACPCSLFGTLAPPNAYDIRGSGHGSSDSGDGGSIELGVKFQPLNDGYVTAVRFYKSPFNVGPHVVNLWTAGGTLLATTPAGAETASGWQEVSLPNAVPVTSHTTYIASYFAPTGHYSYNRDFYLSGGYTNGPLTAPRGSDVGGNNLFTYTDTSRLPDQAFNANYWIDVSFSPTLAADTTPPTIVSVVPAANVDGYDLSTNVVAVFSEGIDPSTINASTFRLRDANGATVAGTVTYNSVQRQATFDPTAGLAPLTTYTATLVGGAGGVKDLAGNPLASNYVWSFTTESVPAIAPDTGPGGPILVLANSSRPFGRYYAEILRTEGLNAFAVSDLASLSPSLLTPYDAVILAETTLSDAQVSILTDWVNAGGRLIAMRPDKKLAGLLGLTDAAATLADTYLLFNTASSPGAGLVNQTIQFHGAADLYTLNGASAIATLYSNPTTATPNPAATLRGLGANGGQAAAFAFDVARSIVYTRQGNPAWVGQDRDGIVPVRSNDLFFGNASFDPQPDYVDLNKVTIPQADELQRFLANLLLQMTASRKPLPRFWYLPRGLKAAVVMTGDDHMSGGTAPRFDHYLAASAPGCSVDDWECIRATAYIQVPDPLTDAQARNYVGQGFEVADHVLVQQFGCANYTLSSLDSVMASELAEFGGLYPSLPAPASNRTHCLPWSDWASQAKVEANHGIRFDTNYYYYPATWIGTNWAGFFTGSGMPQRFADSDGTLIDVYQATTQMTDESLQGYPTTINALLDNALGANGFYGVFTANMHEDQAVDTADRIVASAIAHNVPVVSARQMLEWIDARNNSTFSNLVWTGTALNFTITGGAGARGLRAMLPASGPTGAITGLTLNGAPLSYSIETIKGVQYATFGAATGNYHAAYSVPSLNITSVAQPEGNAGTTPFAFTVTLSDVAAATVTVGYATGNGTAIAGSDYTAQSGTLTFLPGETSHTLTVAVIGDALFEADETFSVNLSSPVNAVIGVGVGVGTIQNDDTPGTPSANAGAAQTVASAAPVTLSGSASDPNNPPQPLTYLWTQTSGPTVTLTGATTLTATFTAPTLVVGNAAVTLGFTLSVNNGASTATSSTTVTVNPPVGAPSASAGAPQTVASAASVTLAGTASDPNNPPKTLTYQWVQTSGPTVTLSGATTLTATFTAPTLVIGNAAVTLGFRLTVSNGTLSTPVTTTVTVNPPTGAPTASAGAAQSVASAASVTLAGTASDPNNPPKTLTYQWVQTSGPAVTLTGATTLTATFTAPTLVVGNAAVTLGFQLTVSNGTLSTPATTSVTVNPPVGAPSASASAPQTVASTASVTLTGTASDPNNPPKTLTYAWTQTSGPAVTLSGATTLTATFTAPTLNIGDAAVTLGFRLTVSNGTLSTPVTTSVTVNPPTGAPTANAGAPQSVASAASVTLTGTASDSNNPPKTLTYAWTQTSGPAVTLSGASTLTATFTAPTLNIGDAAVTLGFRLTVSNGTLSTPATTSVTVNPPIGAPAASVGAPQTVASAASVTLTGTASDPNNPPKTLTYAWTQTSGPTVTLSGATTLTATFTAPTLVVGNAAVTLGFRLTVSNGTLSTPVTTSVTVNPPTGAPTASAGAPQSVPTAASVTLTGTASDPNNPPKPLTYAWTQTSGPTVTLSGAATLTATFMAPTLVVGDAAVTLGFRLTVSNGTLSTPVTTSVTVNPPIGPPTASAGAPQSVASAAAVTLTGTASDPNNPPKTLTYAWTQTSGPVVTLSGASTLTATFTAPTLVVGNVAATLGFQLVVSNGTLSTPVTTTVTVNPPIGAPNASAGAPQTVASAAAVTLTGTASDPNNPRKPLTYQWTQTSGPAITLSGATTTTAAFTAPTLNVGDAAVTLGFQLTVSNGTLSTTVTTTVTVNPPVGAPNANAGVPQSVASAALVTLAGTASDPNNPPKSLTYLWEQTSGLPVTLAGATTLTATFTAPTLTVGNVAVPLGFRLTVSNGTKSTQVTTTVTVNPPIGAPTASAGAPQSVASAASVTLTGTASDPNNPPKSLTYAWTQTSGPAVTLSGASTLTATFTAPTLVVGNAAVTLGFQLVVSNGTLSTPVTTTVTVNPPIGAPAASAGSAQTVTSSAPVTLTGTASDPNNPPKALTYAWTQTSGPAVALSGAATLTATFTAPPLNIGDAALTLGFRLTVSNGTLSTPATTTVTVNAPVGPPTASAGAPQTVASAASVTLAGTASDPNNPPKTLTYQWTQTSGTAVTLSGATTLTATFPAPTLNVGDAAATLGFRLTVSNGTLSTPVTTTVTVNPPIGPPTASAGAPQTVTSAASVTLTGTASDPNNPPKTLTYQWTQTSGPAVTLSGATTLTATFTAPTLNLGDAAVTVGFRLTVSNGTLSTPVTTTVTVNAPVGPPSANAGAPQTVASGAAPVTLTGTASDPNNPPKTLTYAWTQTSGPAVTLSGAAALTATFAAPTLNVGDAAATLGFRLTVSNGTLSTPATTTVTVNPPIGPPNANAGAPQTVSSGGAVTLTGTATDPNNPPKSLTYAWTQTSGPAVALSGATTLVATFTAPTLNVGDAAVTLGFRLTVSNGTLSTPVTTTVTVNPQTGAPNASAGLPQTVASAAPVTLTGTASDPNNPPKTLTFQWTQTSGPTVTLSGATTLTASFTAPTLNIGDTAVTLGFTLTVNNGSFSTPVTTTVTVTAPVGAPTAGASAPQTVASATPVTLTGTASDPNNPPKALTYQWAQTSGPAVTLSGATTLTATFTAPTLNIGDAVATLGFRLTVNNGTFSTPATTTVTVNPPIGPPTANAGAAQSVASAASVTLAGSGTDPNNPPKTLTYQWTQTSGPAVTLSGAATPSATFAAPTLNIGDAAATLGFRLTVNNGTFSTPATTTVTVNPPIGAPTANAGAPQSVASAALVTLAGSGTDPNNPPKALTYQWTQTSGPAVTLSGASTASATFTAATLVVGNAAVTYGFTFTVGNGTQSTPATTTVTVNPPVGPPTANAGAAQSVASASPVTLAGSGTDPNNPPKTLTYQWTQTSGPAVTLTGAATANAGFTAPTLAVGDAAITVGFTLTVGNGSFSTPATTTVTVNPPVGAPTASASAPQSVASAAPVTLSGTASDPNNPPKTLTYQWTQTSGPTVPLAGATTLNASFTAPTRVVGEAAATLGFTLTVSNGSLSTPVTTTVTVNPPIGAPTASAGAAQTATSGATVNLSGTASDPNNPPKTLTYQWTQTSGPAVTLAGATTLQASFTAPPLAIGDPSISLGFLLTVGNGSSTATSPTTVTVNAPVGAPTAGAGLAQTVASGAPVTLLGSASDPNNPPRALTFLWTQASGPAVALSGANTLTPTFSAPALAVGNAAVTLGFTLTVNNGALSTPATTAVQVTPPLGAPIVATAAMRGALSGAQVTLAATATDPNLPALPLLVQWTQTAGVPVVLSNPTALAPTFAAPAVGPSDPPVTLTFQVSVTNGAFSTTANTSVRVLPVAAPTQTVVAEGAGDQTTVPFALQTGDLVVAFVSADGPAAVQQTTTVNGGGLTWTLNERINAGQGTSEIWSALAAAPVAGASVTAALGVPSDPQTLAAFGQSLTVVVYGGAARTGASTHGSAGTGAPSLTLTTTATASLVYGVGNDANAASVRTIATDQAIVHEYLGSNADSHWVQTLAAAPPLPFGAAVTLADLQPSTNRWNFAAIEVVSRGGPTVNAGAPQQVPSATATVALNGSASDSNVPVLPLTFAWTQIGGPAVALASTGAPVATFAAPRVAPGALPVVLQFQLTVSNGAFSATAATTVTVLAEVALAPTANAGAPQTAWSGSAVTLAGSGSDLNVPPLPLTFAWAQTAGPAVTLSNAATAAPTFTAPALNIGDPAVTLGFRMTVSNALGSTTADTTVTVNAPLPAPTPFLTIGSDGVGRRTTSTFSVGSGDVIVAFVSADAAGSQQPQTATVTGGGLTWTLVRRTNTQFGSSEIWTATAAATLNNITVSSALAYLVDTSYQSLTVMAFAGSDGVGASSTANAATGAPSVTVTTSKPNSLAYAVGNDWDRATVRTLPAGQSIVRQFLGPADTHWVQTLTGGVPIAGTAARLNDTAPTGDRWNFSAVEVVGTSRPPLAPPTTNVPATQTVNSGALVTLAGSGSDANLPPRPLTYAWAQTEGPAVTISNGATANASFVAPTLAVGAQPVTLRFRLTVSNGPTSSNAIATVVVQAPPKVPAVVQTAFSDGQGKRTTSSIPVSAGDLLVAFVAADVAGTLSGQTATVTGGSLTWTLVRRTNTQFGSAEIWKATAAAAGSVAVSSTLSVAASTSYQSLTVVTFSNASTGATAGVSAASGAPSLTLTTTSAFSLVYAVGNDWDRAQSRTLGTGQKMVHQYLGPADTHWTQTLTAGLVSTAGTVVTMNDTAPTNDRWNLTAVEIVVR